MAGLAVVGAALRREFPQLVIGVQVLTHNAEGPLAIAQAIGAQFVRLKVYVGAMVKAEGILEGLAYAAIQYRARLGADEVRILADVYDRTGEPLARASPTEEATQAVTFGRADGLVLSGKTFDESQRMLTEVRAAGLGVPLYLGGGATVNNVGQALAVCDGVIVSPAFKTKQGWTRESLASDWDEGKIRDFMRAAGQAGAA